MRQFELGLRGRVGVAALERVGQPGDQQPVFDRAQALGAFGVARAHVVLAAGGVGVVAGRFHRCLLFPLS